MGFVAGLSDAPGHAPHSRVPAHTSERTDKMQNVTQSAKHNSKYGDELPQMSARP